jgi:hypothetical protein
MLPLVAAVRRLWTNFSLMRHPQEVVEMKLSRLKERLRHGADVCQITQQKIVALENAPEDRKRLRQFPTVEAAMVLGVSESYLRQITKEGAEFTCGTVVGNNYRSSRLPTSRVVPRRPRQPSISHSTWRCEATAFWRLISTAKHR